MPIRLNLLAEAQAAEDMRRRDPVKRIAWAAALLIASMLVWSSSIQLKAKMAGDDLARLDDQGNKHAAKYQKVLDNQKRAAELQEKLSALRELTTNRFLNATLLDALQRSTVEDVQLLSLRIQQAYARTEGTKPRTNDDRILPGTPATVTERIMAALDSNDSSPSPGDQVNKVKEAVAANPYFGSTLVKTNAVRLRSLSAPQLSPATGKPCVLFTLEFHFPDHTR